jgi:hypothetical protein
MKKWAWLGLILFWAVQAAWAGGFRLALKGSYFSAEDAAFRDVYGSAARVGLEGDWQIADHLWIWTGLDQVHKTGGLTLTGEVTRVWITPIGAGLRYEIPGGERLAFHLQAGLQEVFFKEENLLGTAAENGLGFIAGGGADYRLTGALEVGLFVSWSTCKLTHDGVGFKTGGLDAGGAIAVRF